MTPNRPTKSTPLQARATISVVLPPDFSTGFGTETIGWDFVGLAAAGRSQCGRTFGPTTP